MNPTPIFSILHTSARPEKWREIYIRWLAAAEHPDRIEYVLVVDERWGFPPATDPMYANMRAQDVVTFNNGRRCYVDGVNTAASVSSGDVLVVIADDQYPCQGWDTKLMGSVAEVMLKKSGMDYVLWPHTRTPNEYERAIVVMPIVSRARYQRLGYVFYGQYESMYADNDLCAHAMKDGVLHRLPSDWVFPHLHPFFSDTPMDAAYEAQNRQPAYDLGAEIFRLRTSAGFADIPPVVIGKAPPARKHLAVCLPGRQWPLEFMSAWTDLVMRATQIVNFTPLFAAASDPGIVRQLLSSAVQNDLQLPADFVLWIDSDNVLPFPYLLEMLRTLDTRPEITAVAAWCWLLYPAGRLSCGNVNEEHGHIEPLDYTAMMAAPDDLQEVHYTGFPAILMRREMIEQAGTNPFCPIVSETFHYGKSGEDYAFCVRARANGARIFVDRRLKIDHLKLGTIDGEAQARAAAAVPETELPAEPTANELAAWEARRERIPVPVGKT